MRASSSRYCLSAPCAFFTVRGLRKYCCEILSIFSGLSFRLLAFKNKGKKGSFFFAATKRGLNLERFLMLLLLQIFLFPITLTKGQNCRGMSAFSRKVCFKSVFSLIASCCQAFSLATATTCRHPPSIISSVVALGLEQSYLAVSKASDSYSRKCLPPLSC